MICPWIVMKVCCSVVGQPLNGLCSFHTFNKTGERTEVKRDQHVLGAKHRRDNAYRWEDNEAKIFHWRFFWNKCDWIGWHPCRQRIDKQHPRRREKKEDYSLIIPFFFLLFFFCSSFFFIVVVLPQEYDGGIVSTVTISIFNVWWNKIINNSNNKERLTTFYYNNYYYRNSFSNPERFFGIFFIWYLACYQ